MIQHLICAFLAIAGAAMGQVTDDGDVAGFCPGVGSCFTSHPTPGCDNELCCALVCSADPKCCIFGWDNLCVQRANLTCSADPCPGAGSCFETHRNPGCNDAMCCDAVCDSLSSCCSVGWTEECVTRAETLCVQPPCPRTGSCFEPHGTPGCDIEGCCGSVCDAEPACCEQEWTSSCVERAVDLCGNDACPGEGSCLEFHIGAGCRDADCCNRVCAADGECCFIRWDNLCIAEARRVCHVGCPRSGSCLDLHENPGCDDASCCQRVCESRPDCCLVEQPWNAECVALARDLCQPNCPDGTLTALEPTTGVVDARQPHPVDGEMPLQGISEVLVSGVGSADPRCWRLCDNPDEGTPNEINDIAPEGSNYRLAFSRPITPGAATLLNYEPSESSASQMVLISLPGDVNGRDGVTVEDIMALYDCLNTSDPKVAAEMCPWGAYSFDLDHSGEGGFADLARWIEVATGADAFAAWLGVAEPIAGDCP